MAIRAPALSLIWWSSRQRVGGVAGRLLLVVGLWVGFALVCAVAVRIAWQEDSLHLARQRQLLDTALRSRELDLALELTRQAALAAQGDPAWRAGARRWVQADEGRIVATGDGNVVEASDDAVAASRHQDEPERHLLLRATLARLEDAARIAGTAGLPPVTGADSLDGRPFLLAMALLPAHAAESALALVEPLDDAALGRIAAQLGLDGLRWTREPDAAVAHGYALRDPWGGMVGTLVWDGHRPGQAMLAGLLPALALLALAGGLVVAHLAREADRAARRLDAAERRLVHDPLTGLPNRLLLMDRLERGLAAWRRDGTPLAVLYLDLDGFKAVNDGLGHEAGDRVLGLVAARLVAALRDIDTVARLGGDEFVILEVGGAQPAAAQALCARLQALFREPFEIDGRCLPLGCSIGVATARVPAVEPMILLRQADLALYEAKRAGRGTWRFFDDGKAPVAA